MRAQVHITWIQVRSCPDLPCDVMRTLFLSLYACAAAECANCEAPVQSAALLQSSAQRTKGPAPHAFGPAHFFGPGPYERHTFGPPMGANMAGRMGPRMPQLRHMPPRHNQSFVKMDASSMYGSTYGGAAFTPCDNPGAFDPSLEIWGYCDMWSMSITPTEQECTAAGCRWSYGWCDCLEKPGCLAVGGRWDSHTCANELENLEYYKADLETAIASGTCEGSQGDFLKSVVAYPASHCCSDYPNTFCEKGIQKMTPCKDWGLRNWTSIGASCKPLVRARRLQTSCQMPIITPTVTCGR